MNLLRKNCQRQRRTLSIRHRVYIFSVTHCLLFPLIRFVTGLWPSALSMSNTCYEDTCVEGGGGGHADEKGKAEGGGKQEVRTVTLGKVHLCAATASALPPPINPTFLFTDPTSSKSAFTYNCVKHHLPAL